MAFHFYGDPEVTKFIANGKPSNDLEQIQKLLLRFNEHQTKYGYSPWAVVDRPSCTVVGICGLHTYNAANEPELGFRISRSHWGKGIATEACRMSIQYGFREMKLPWISALTHPENFATQKVLGKVGFSLIGDVYIEDRKLMRYEKRPTTPAPEWL